MKYKLTDTAIKQAKPKEKDYSMADGGGLRLMVKKDGKKVFIFNYNRPFTKAKNNLTIGYYGDISLQEARKRHAEARALLEQDIDPAQRRAQEKQAGADNHARTFEKMAVQWFEGRKLQANFSERTAKETWALFDRHILPLLGQYPIAELTPLTAINALKPLEKQGKLETIRKIISKVNDVMRYALHRGFISANNLAEIGREFDKPAPQSMNTIEPDELAEFLTKFYHAKAQRRFDLNTFYAVLLVLLTGGRPSEIASARWDDINESERTWRYRVQKGNKNLPEGRLHTVTLSNQALGVFAKMREYNAILHPNYKGDFVFFSPAAKVKGHLSIEAMRKAIVKAIGENRLTTHGIRHLFSTTLNEQDFNADWIERALSHKDRNRIRASYNKAEYIPQRFSMLQAWADYLESLLPDGVSLL